MPSPPLFHETAPYLLFPLLDITCTTLDFTVTTRKTWFALVNCWKERWEITPYPSFGNRSLPSPHCPIPCIFLDLMPLPARWMTRNFLASHVIDIGNQFMSYSTCMWCDSSFIFFWFPRIDLHHSSFPSVNNLSSLQLSTWGHDFSSQQLISHLHSEISRNMPVIYPTDIWFGTFQWN